MDNTPWYKRLLCGYNPLGDFAELANKGTEINIPLAAEDLARKHITTKCWCCTFWRGIVIGMLLGGSVGYFI